MVAGVPQDGAILLLHLSPFLISRPGLSPVGFRHSPTRAMTTRCSNSPSRQRLRSAPGLRRRTGGSKPLGIRFMQRLLRAISINASTRARPRDQKLCFCSSMDSIFKAVSSQTIQSCVRSGPQAPTAGYFGYLRPSHNSNRVATTDSERLAEPVPDEGVEDHHPRDHKIFRSSSGLVWRKFIQVAFKG
jgi:hypothetical protein